MPSLVSFLLPLTDEKEGKEDLKPLPSKGWAAMIRKVYEVDPLLCPKCGGTMKVIAFITDYQAVDRIIDHLKLTFVAEKPPPVLGLRTGRPLGGRGRGGVFLTDDFKRRRRLFVFRGGFLAVRNDKVAGRPCSQPFFGAKVAQRKKAISYISGKKRYENAPAAVPASPKKACVINNGQ